MFILALSSPYHQIVFLYGSPYIVLLFFLKPYANTEFIKLIFSHSVTQLLLDFATWCFCFNICNNFCYVYALPVIDAVMYKIYTKKNLHIYAGMNLSI